MNGPSRSPQDRSADMSQAWVEVPDRIRAGKTLPEPWEGLFGALRQDAGKCVTIGQLGQSLDGRIATLSGHSHYISGSEGLAVRPITDRDHHRVAGGSPADPERVRPAARRAGLSLRRGGRSLAPSDRG